MNKGYTLIELIISITIGTIVLTILVMTSLSGNETFANTNSAQERTSTFFEAFNSVDAAVRTGIEFPTTYNDTQITNTTYSTSDGHTLITKQYALKNSTGQVDCTKFDYIIFTSDGNNDFKQIIIPDASSVRTKEDGILFSSISSLSFTQDKPGPKHRQVTMIMEATLPAPNKNPLSHQQTMVARND